MEYCVLCGAPKDWAERLRAPWEQSADRHGWDRREYTMFSAGVVKEAVTAGASYEKRRPTRAATVASDVLVPVLQSGISGIVSGILGGAGAGIAGLPHPVLIGLGAGACGLGLAWVVILREHRQALWEIEKIVGRDLDGDGVVGRLVPKPEPLKVEVTTRDERGRLRQMQWLDLPPSITDETLADLAEAVLLNGRDFSRRKLPDGLLSPDDYGAIKDAMLQGGLLRYKGKGEQAGVELTGAGRAFLRQFIDG
jgi:hypothetical protein